VATVATAAGPLPLPTTKEPADSVSRFSLFKSARTSAALWQRRSRFFSSPLLMIRSSSAGSPGFSCSGDIGAWFRMALKTAAEVPPLKGDAPVAIWYNTTPNEKRSVRASSSSP
jgi:hypothetical protein